MGSQTYFLDTFLTLKAVFALRFSDSGLNSGISRLKFLGIRSVGFRLNCRISCFNAKKGYDK